MFQVTPAGESQDENNVGGYSLRHRRKAVLLKGVFNALSTHLIILLYSILIKGCVAKNKNNSHHD